MTAKIMSTCFSFEVSCPNFFNSSEITEFEAPKTSSLDGNNTFTNIKYTIVTNNTENGKPKDIHFTKEIWVLYSFSSKPINTEFGGVPITVAIPPAFAENAIPSITLSAKFLSDFVKPSSSLISKFITDMAMGNITTVLAVLLIHILIKAVAIIKPSITLLGDVPVSFIIVKAMRLWRFTFSKAKANTKPPKNKNTIGLP